VTDLCEVNKDILLGRRKLDCLSCGHEKKASDGLGADGRVYKSITPLGKHTINVDAIRNTAEI